MCKSAILISKKDYLLTEGIKYVCKQQKVNLTYCLTFPELLYHSSNFKPEIIFYDEESLNFPYELYKDFVTSKLFYVPKIVLITPNPSKFNFSEKNIKIVNKHNFCEEIPLILNNVEEKHVNELSPEYIEKIKDQTTKILYDLGITSKYLGYEYIKELVVYVKTDKRLLQSFNKKLYPILAMQVNTNVNNIERNIRNAIAVASERSKNKRLFDEISYRNSLINPNPVPSNKQFITWLVEQVG